MLTGVKLVSKAEFLRSLNFFPCIYMTAAAVPRPRVIKRRMLEEERKEEVTRSERRREEKKERKETLN